MSEHDTAAQAKRKLGLGNALQPFFPAIALVLALIGAWLAWSGWVQLRSEQREAALVSSRDAVAKKIGTATSGQLAELSKRLASDPVQAALATGDLPAAGSALRHGWADVQSSEVLVDGFDPLYNGLPATGFGKVGLAEAAISENKPVAGRPL